MNQFLTDPFTEELTTLLNKHKVNLVASKEGILIEDSQLPRSYFIVKATTSSQGFDKKLGCVMGYVAHEET